MYTGKRLGNYRLIRPVGQGGYAQVYLAFHLLLEVPVAMKLLHGVSLSEANYAHFLEEARMIARLEHAYIIRIRDFSVIDGVPFLVMDYAAGGSFRRYCPPGSRLPLTHILPLVQHIAEALDYAHERGIVHCDIKPENLLIRRREVVLSDFGLATLQTESLPGQIRGTPRYVAPEQTWGRIDPASDQYALAVCVYEWLAGQPPFIGKSAELLEQHRFTYPPSLCQQVPGLPFSVEEVVRRALAKRPEERFPNVQAFATALRAAAHAGRQAGVERAASPEKPGQPSLSLPVGHATVEANTVTPDRSLPVERNPLFTGRETILAHLHSLLTASETGTVALTGLGGIGKTQIAVEYAYRFASTWDGIFFVRAETREAFLSAFPGVAGLLHLAEKTEAVTAWFKTHAHWLVILDNVEDLSWIEEVMPAQRHLVLTTRTQMVGRANVLDVGEMIEEEAVAFLLRRAGVLKQEDEGKGIEPVVWRHAKEIARLLDGLPLALDQAGAYIEEAGCPLYVYLTLYRTRGHLLLLQRRGQRGNYPDSVATTWSLSIERVRLANPIAADLLTFCAFLVPDAIPEELLCAATQEAFADPLVLGGALYELGKYSLVRREQSIQSLSLHRLVQLVVRETLSLEERHEWVQRVVRALLNAFPREEEAFWVRSQRILPHVEEILAQIEQEHLVLVEAGKLFNRAGLSALKQAFYAQGECLLRAALDQRMVLLGGDHPDVGESLNDLGMVYYLQADLAQAERYFRRALTIKQQAEGNTAHVAVALNNVASLCRKQKRFAEAEQLFREALAIWQSHCESSSQADMARMLNNLALLYQDQKRDEEAESVLRQALQIWREIFTQRMPDPDMAKTLTNLGKLCRDQGRFGEAEDMFLHAQETQARALLPDHPEVAQTLSELAFLYTLTGCEEEAESLYIFALEIFEQALGPNHQRASQTFAGYQALLLGQVRTLPSRFASWVG